MTIQWEECTCVSTICKSFAAPLGQTELDGRRTLSERRAGSAAQGNGRPQETAAASVSQRPPKPVQPAKGYVAGESVEFDIAAEEEEQGEQSQMELI